MCNAHRLKLQRRGDATRILHRRYGPDAQCEAVNCARRPVAKGLCKPHYESADRIPKPRRPAEERFWAKVDETDDCWLWTGTLTKEKEGEGYGQFKVNGRTIVAHRFAWELVNEEIPADLVVDHLCRVRRCVRPEHLELVTPYENMLRGDGFPARQARQTHCKRGHALSGDNVRVVNNGRSRRCLACRRERERRH